MIVAVTRRPVSMPRLVVGGAVAGAIATWLMDVVTTGVQRYQTAEDAEREAAARPHGQSSVANLVDLASRRLGGSLDRPTKDLAANVVHYALGIIPGAAYAVLRDQAPVVGSGRGLLFGAVLWAVNDELLNTALGLAAPPDAYPPSSHVRGLIGHLVLGVGTDVGIDLTSHMP
jgi:hypothetical protein